MSNPNPPQPEFQPPYQVPPTGEQPEFKPTWSQDPSVNPYAPAPPPIPGYEPPKRTSPWLKVGIIGIIFLALLLLFGACVAAMSAPDARQSAGTPSASPTLYPKNGSWDNGSTTTPPTTPPKPVRSKANIDKSDLELRIKTLSKKCYGYGVGCTIEYKIKLGADRTGWPKDGTVDVTYKVKGGEDGPERNTLTMDLSDGTYEQDGYQYASTRSSGVKLKVSIVDLEYSEW